MKKFVAYFDFLGFKDFILNNTLEDQKQGMRNIYRDIELALSDRKTVEGKFGRIADLSSVKINCINFSDTVVFWSNDDSIDSLAEMLRTAYAFNWHQNLFTFPVRGAVVYGEIEHSDFRHASSSAGKYNVNSVYGRGLVDAYLKAENQKWAGTVIDDSIITFLQSRKIDLEGALGPFAKRYKVPYHKENVPSEEFTMKLVKSLNEESFDNLSKSIRRNFGELKKGTDHPSVKEKLKNTIDFLKSHITRT